MKTVKEPNTFAIEATENKGFTMEFSLIEQRLQILEARLVDFVEIDHLRIEVAKCWAIPKSFEKEVISLPEHQKVLVIYKILRNRKFKMP